MRQEDGKKDAPGPPLYFAIDARRQPPDASAPVSPCVPRPLVFASLPGLSAVAPCRWLTSLSPTRCCWRTSMSCGWVASVKH